MDLPYAEDMNYWKTSKSGADSWLEKTVKLITALGGNVGSYAFGQEPATGRGAYMMNFRIGSDEFRLIWPVLPTRNGSDTLHARRQAATMLYHDTKTKCLKAAIFGARSAFLEYLKLPGGPGVIQLTNQELAEHLPNLLPAGDY
jgi:hypothetical protein